MLTNALFVSMHNGSAFEAHICHVKMVALNSII